MLINTGLKIHRGATVVVPAEIGKTMLGIAGILPNHQLEYGLYLQGTWDPTTATVRVLPDKFYFPEQEVTSVSIRFLEEPPGPEWNVVIHRHPHSCRAFSSTDKNSINEEFLASILYIPTWDFPDAVVNIPLGAGSKFQTAAKVVVDGGLIEVPDWLRERVEQSLHQLKVVHAQGPQKAGRGTIEALDGDGTIHPEPSFEVPPSRKTIKPLRIGPRIALREEQPEFNFGSPALLGNTDGFSTDDIVEMQDAMRLANLGINT